VGDGEKAGPNTGISDIRDIRETLRVQLDGYGLSLAASAGGKYVTLGGMVPSQHGLIHLFDSSGKQLWRHKTREAISTVAISRGGEIIAAASDDNNIYCFDKIGLLQWRHETSRMIKSMALSEAGDFLAAGGEDHNLYYFDKNRQIRKFVWKYKFEDAVNSVDISASGRHIIAGSNDRFVAYFDGAGELMWSHECREPVNAVRMSQDGGLVAVGSSDHMVYMFNGTGMQLFAQDCGAPVRALAMSRRGDVVVAAAGSSLHCLDSHGVRLWTLELPSVIAKLACSEFADTVLVATEDKMVYLVTRPGTVVWKYSCPAGVYGMALSDDRGLGFCCGPMELNQFDNFKTFRELATRHQGAITAAKREGQDTSAMEGSLKQALSQLGTRDLVAAAEGFKEVQDALSAVENISQERDKLRRDTGEAIARMSVTVEQLGAGATGPSQEHALKDIRELAKNAQASFKAGKFAEALALVRKVEEATGAIRETRNAGQEVQRLLDDVSAQVQASKALEVDTSAAEGDLAEARRRFMAGDIVGAGELARVAAGAILSARVGSPKAMEAEFDRACKLLASPVVTGPELVLAEEGLAGALALLIERRQFLTVAESYERLAACWSRRPQDVSALAGQQEALRMAINAYRDAGKLDNAVALAKQMGDWVTAAKLLSLAGDKNRQAEAWVKATTLRKPKPPIPDDLKERVEVQLAHGQFFEAAGILASFGFGLESSKVLARGEYDMRSAALMLRLQFNFQDFPEMLERSKPYLAAMRKRAKETADSGDWANYAHMLVGTLEIANLLDAPESHLVMSELSEFAHDYARGLAREEVRANEICDLTVLYTHLRERNWKAMERLAELKGGPFWEHFKIALAAWRDVNIYLFREQTRQLLRVRPEVFRYPTQSLDRVAWEGDPHEALAAMQPFNYPAVLCQLLERFSNKDYLASIVARADAEMAAGRDERAAAVYEQALGMDTFGQLDSKKLHLRTSGIYLTMRKEAEAAPHLDAAGASKEAALTDYRAARGLGPAARRPPPRTLVASAPSKNACPGCGSAVPSKAIRCYRCGAALK
jgi:outer membrane protein assembly factor BamB